MPGSGSKWRIRGAVGATLVEYSLVVAVLLVPSVAAISWLTTQSGKETNAQADCVSMRPPPVSCQAKSITTTTSTTAPPPTTTTTIAGPTTTTTAPPTTTTTAAPVGSATWNTTASTYTGGSTRRITLQVDLKSNPGNVNLPDAIVSFKMTITPGGYSFAASCTSNAAGTCIGTFDVPAGVTSVSGEVVRIESVPATSTLPTNVLTWSTP